MGSSEDGEKIIQCFEGGGGDYRLKKLPCAAAQNWRKLEAFFLEMMSQLETSAPALQLETTTHDKNVRRLTCY